MHRNKVETIQFLTRDEIRRLLSAITAERDKAIFLVAYRFYQAHARSQKLSRLILQIGAAPRKLRQNLI
jgi:hypothetical protein